MGEEYSLDDFLSADEDGDAGEAPDRETSTPPGEADPATATSRHVPDGKPCAACGTVVSRLWIQEGEAVCPDCKEW